MEVQEVDCKKFDCGASLCLFIATDTSVTSFSWDLTPPDNDHAQRTEDNCLS